MGHRRSVSNRSSEAWTRATFARAEWRFAAASSAANLPHEAPAAREVASVRGGRGNPQHLPRLDLVGIVQLILVRVEDRHVRVAVAKHFPGDLAQSVSGLDR